MVAAGMTNLHYWTIEYKKSQRSPTQQRGSSFAARRKRCSASNRPGGRLLRMTCAVKGAGLQRVQLPPGNWFVPPGSNRSGGEGNEATGAFDEKGRLSDSASVQAVT